MPIEVNGIKLYSSSEVAEMFDISVTTVRSWRFNHRIEGQRIGSNTYFTQEQVDAAREPKTRGPKPKGKKKEEELVIAKEEDSDEGRDNSPLVMLGIHSPAKVAKAVCAVGA
jgi:hypothetical protein